MQRQGKGRNGNALVAVLGVVLVLSTFLIVGVRASLQRAHTARLLGYRIQAQSIAETGAGRAYLALEADFDLRTNTAAFPATNYAGGTYDVAVIPLGDDGAVIECTATYKNVTEAVMLDTKMHNRDSEIVVQPAYGYAILADGRVTWTGCGVFEGESRIHANGTFRQAGSGELNCDVSSSVSITLNGKSGMIDGDVAAPEVSGKTEKVTGTITECAVDEVPIPAIDLVPYYNEALAHGEVFDGARTITGNYAPSGGVMWVNGDLHLSGPGMRTGCFIATGGIHLSGSGGQTKVAGYPAFLSRDGNIKMAGSGSYEGLIYARIGNVEITGGGRLTGSIVCGGDFKKAGVSTVFSFVESVPISPADVPSDGILCISAWQK